MGQTQSPSSTIFVWPTFVHFCTNRLKSAPQQPNRSEIWTEIFRRVVQFIHLMELNRNWVLFCIHDLAVASATPTLSIGIYFNNMYGFCVGCRVHLGPDIYIWSNLGPGLGPPCSRSEPNEFTSVSILVTTNSILPKDGRNNDEGLLWNGIGNKTI